MLCFTAQERFRKYYGLSLALIEDGLKPAEAGSKSILNLSFVAAEAIITIYGLAET
jgi:hypothetical protein